MVDEATLDDTDAGTEDGAVAYARFAPARQTRYPGGVLPGG